MSELRSGFENAAESFVGWVQRGGASRLAAYSAMIAAMAVVTAWRPAVGGIGIAILCHTIGLRRAVFVLAASAALLAAVSGL